MGSLVLSLLPLSLGIIMSPLAIMALVAVLLSKQARRNGVAFLLGWAVAIVLLLSVSFAIFSAIEVREVGDPPVWVPVVRLVLALLFIVGGIYVYRRGRVHLVAMSHAKNPTQVAQAAPQLPGWLRAVETFTPARSFLLGLGIFALNPVDASCAILAALDVRLSGLDGTTVTIVFVVFAILGILPIAIPVVLVLVKREAADPALGAIKRWIASHTGLLNALLLFVIAALQLQKAVSGFLAL